MHAINQHSSANVVLFFLRKLEFALNNNIYTLLLQVSSTSSGFIDEAHSFHRAAKHGISPARLVVMSTNSSSDLIYQCSFEDSSSDVRCAETCIGVEECGRCPCRVVLTDGAGGPWGDVVDVLLILTPIVVLIVVTVKPKHPWPATASLPFAAALLAWIRLAYYHGDPLLVLGAVVLGIHQALTPISILAGAITLFECMEASLCLPFMMREMKVSLTAEGHPVAELMLIFAFAYLMEGVSGFVVVAAPVLVAMGHPATESVVTLLLFETFASAWGAIGAPIWFGLGQLSDDAGNYLSEAELVRVSKKAAVALAVSAFLLIPFILTILVPVQMVKSNLIFVYTSLIVTVGPSAGLACVSYDFPALAGGMVGCGITAVLIKLKVGLKRVSAEQSRQLRRCMHDIGGISEHGLVRSYHRSILNASARNASHTNSLANIVSDWTDPPTASTDSQLSSGLESVVEEGVIDSSALQPLPGELAFAELTEWSNVNGIIDGDIEQSADTPVVTPGGLSLRETVDARLGPRKTMQEGYMKELVLRTFPLWATVLVLILTRVEAIGIKQYLTKQSPFFSIHFGTYGTFRLSVSAVFELRDILTYPGLNWKYELLYVPFVLPYVMVSSLTVVLFHKDLTCRPRDIVLAVGSRLRNPTIALLEALILVQLMIQSGTAAPAYILGKVLSDWFQEGFVVISPLLGVLGSFFSSSTSISNLAFGSIQQIAAESVGTSVTSMLALQTAGGSAGIGVCLNNIIALCAVVGLDVGEGQILRKTYKFAFLSTTISTLVMWAFFFRFNG